MSAPVFEKFYLSEALKRGLARFIRPAKISAGFFGENIVAIFTFNNHKIVLISARIKIIASFVLRI